MKKLFMIGLFISLIFLVSCKKEVQNNQIDEELARHSLSVILLENVYLDSTTTVYAIAKTLDAKEVLIKYVNSGGDLLILEVLNLPLAFSYEELIAVISNLADKGMRNAFNAVIRQSERVEITENVEIKEVLKVNKLKKFNALVFYFDIEGEYHKFVFAYDLGDYYISNETTKEIYYPLNINYEDFP